MASPHTPNSRIKLLILGGTTEAADLARRCDAHRRINPLLSLAGRTKTPRLPITRTRIGGFGGIEGLIDFLATETIDLIVDATHPFANQMSRNAANAASRLGLPVLGLRRPEWQPVAWDRWTRVANFEAAVDALGDQPLTAFLGIGRLEIRRFERAPQHRYVLRTIDPPDPFPRLPHLTVLYGQGPFDRAAEVNLFRQHRVDVIVTKNSGGKATYAKIEAARDLSLPVFVIDRPIPPDIEAAETTDEVLAWIEAHIGSDV